MPRMTKSNLRTLFISLGLLLAVVVGCRDFDDRAGSSGFAEITTADASGTWAGDWLTVGGARDGEGGTLTMVVEQESEGKWSGTSTWDGTGDGYPAAPVPCWPQGAVAGVVVGTELVAGQALSVPADAAGTKNCKRWRNGSLIDTRCGKVTVFTDLTIVGNSMSGTFLVDTDNGNRCNPWKSRDEDVGARDLTRQ